MAIAPELFTRLFMRTEKLSWERLLLLIIYIECVYASAFIFDKLSKRLRFISSLCWLSNSRISISITLVYGTKDSIINSSLSFSGDSSLVLQEKANTINNANNILNKTFIIYSLVIINKRT